MPSLENIGGDAGRVGRGLTAGAAGGVPGLAPLDNPTAQLIVLPDPYTIRGHAAQTWLGMHLADNEGPDGLLPHERTHNTQEAA